jgi:pimeloyl-ACP methyl ester carboxylesterase
MKNFVLVHGAWHGGWCWRRVLPLLREEGHGAYAVTLTGTGERSHLLSHDIDLSTHIEDVLALIRCEELDNVVLVGHSYGGMVITGAADILLQDGSATVKQLIFVDAIAPYPGESWSSQHSAEVVASRTDAGTASGLLSLPPPDANVYGLTGKDLEWVCRRQTLHPFGVYLDPLNFNFDQLQKIPRTFVSCVSPPLSTIDAMRRRVLKDPGWTVHELQAGHDPMIEQPAALANILLETAA